MNEQTDTLYTVTVEKCWTMSGSSWTMSECDGLTWPEAVARSDAEMEHWGADYRVSVTAE